MELQRRKGSFSMWEENRGKRKGIRILTIVIVSVFFSLFSRFMIARDEQKREREREELQEQYMQEAPTSLEKQQEMMQDILQESSEFSESIRQRMDQMLEDGTMEQEEYDSLMQHFGFEKIESDQ